MWSRITKVSLLAVVLAVLQGTEGTDLRWTQGRSVDVTVGPEDAVYCRIQDPQNRVIFENFGKCRIVVDRVAAEHGGAWKVTTGLPGKIQTEETTLNVQVQTSANRPTVSVHVATEKPAVIIGCSLPAEYPVRSCSFRGPSGRVLMSNAGTAEDSVTLGETRVEADTRNNECSLRLEAPEVADLGLWRCTVETNTDVYYGFLSVLCPWSMSQPEIAAQVVTDPTLTFEGNTNTVLIGDSATMSCSIQSAIRYCQFRARNGTVFSVSPATAGRDYEYFGAGLDAGECGIRIRNLVANDNGQWSCHVGLPTHSEPEQRVNFFLNVAPPMEMEQNDAHGNTLLVTGQAFDNLALEYCRYIRMDGESITIHNPIARYTIQENLSRGTCAISISGPTILDHHSWTVAAKAVGREGELYGTTIHTISMPTPPAPEPEPTPPVASTQNNNNVFVWILASISFLLIVLVAVLLVPRRNRQQTLERFGARNSMVKDPAALATPPQMTA